MPAKATEHASRRRWPREITLVRISAVLILALLLAAVPAGAADEASQIQLLRQIFRLPQPEWPALLEENKALLDDSFFQRCEARIRWGRENNMLEDAIRFSLVANTALKVLGLPPRFPIPGFSKHLSIVLPGGCEFGGVQLSEPDPRDPLPARVPAALVEPRMIRLGDVYVEDVPFPSRRCLPLISERTRASAAVFFQQAENRQAEGRWVEAKLAYIKGLRTDPSCLAAYLPLARILCRLGEEDQAIDWLVQAVNYSSDDPATWRCLGAAYERRFDQMGDNNDAKLASFAYLLAFRRSSQDVMILADLERACVKRWSSPRQRPPR